MGSNMTGNARKMLAELVDIGIDIPTIAEKYGISTSALYALQAGTTNRVYPATYVSVQRAYNDHKPKFKDFRQDEPLNTNMDGPRQWLSSLGQLGLSDQEISSGSGLSNETIRRIRIYNSRYHSSTVRALRVFHDNVTNKCLPSGTQEPHQSLTPVALAKAPQNQVAAQQEKSPFTATSDFVTIDALISMLRDEGNRCMRLAREALEAYRFDESQRAMQQAKVFRDACAVILSAKPKQEDRPALDAAINTLEE
jgi:hypothetical protein